MNQARYLALREKLRPWSDLWAHSVLKRFEPMEERVPDEWFAWGAGAPLEAQHRLLLGRDEPSAPESLRTWVRELRGACELPRLTRSRAITTAFAEGLTPKKRHELERLLAFLEAEGAAGAKVLDLGGGAGHLARQLARELGCQVVSVDRDGAVQARGRAILSRRPWRDSLGSGSVRFEHGAFPGIACDAADWVVGLHTCGALAWSQLELARDGVSMLNVGCCYETMRPESDTHRSRFARENPLPLTEEALFLANRGGVERTLDEFAFQQRVLRYRFSLPEGLESVGNASRREYLGSLEDYARGRGAALGEVDERRVERRRFATLLRYVLARPVELALLLDRALFVEERAGRAASLVEVFDSALSPRNVGLAYRFVKDGRVIKQ